MNEKNVSLALKALSAICLICILGMIAGALTNKPMLHDLATIAAGASGAIGGIVQHKRSTTDEGATTPSTPTPAPESANQPDQKEEETNAGNAS